jgi:TRAP-type C4-dicarboxylate transport system substrate-binding protein
MRTIGIGELQKNMGILTHLTEALTIVDKRKNKEIAVVYPVNNNKHNMIEEMSRKFQKKFKERGIVIKDLDKAKEDAMMEAMKEKYGFSD